jgi:hypothetical protein
LIVRFDKQAKAGNPGELGSETFCQPGFHNTAVYKMDLHPYPFLISPNVL